MDNNFKKKIDDLVSEINQITDLNHKVSVLNYLEQQSSYMLWLLEDEQRIDEDSRDFWFPFAWFIIGCFGIVFFDEIEVEQI